MKAIIVLLALALIFAVSAADETEVEDLGTISPKRGVVLEKCQRRLDFQSFKIEVIPQVPPTNVITIVKTNDLLALADLVQAPSGPAIIFVRQVCSDGMENEPTPFKIDIYRAGPTRTRAHGITIGGAAEPDRSATNVMRGMRQRRADAAPLPPLPSIPGKGFERAPGTNDGPIPPATRWPQSNRPLPGGTNRSYAEHLDQQAAFYNRAGRRNE